LDRPAGEGGTEEYLTCFPVSAAAPTEQPISQTWFPLLLLPLLEQLLPVLRGTFKKTNKKTNKKANKQNKQKDNPGKK
jgi:hypothetical protein